MFGRRLRRDDRGVSALELAIIAPSLIFLIFFVVQAALYFYARAVALQAAREAVSQIRLQQTTQQCTAAIPNVTSYAEGYASDVGGGFIRDVQVPANLIYCRPDTVTLTVTAHSLSLVGFDFDISETVSGRVEHFQVTQ